MDIKRMLPGIAGVILIILVLVAPAGAETWGTEVVDSEGDVGWDTSLALDSSGHPHISYYDFSNSDLKYASWNGNAWTTTTVDSKGIVGRYTSLALDSSGNPHISYHDYSNGDLKYASWNGTAWTTTTVDSEGDVGRWTSLALDSSGNPHISYSDYLKSHDLKYASWNGTAWETTAVDSEGDVGMDTSLALDSSGHPHISYSDYSNDDLKYVSWNGTAWETDTVDSEDDVGKCTSLALDSLGNPHISYYDYSNMDLKYALWNGTAWVTTTVDSDGVVGSHTSLAVDSSGHPHISYHDFSNHNLKYVSWDGTAWGTTTVDSDGSVGQYTSLALDSSGYPHISYFDGYPNNDLKYARIFTAPVSGFTGFPVSGPAPLTVNFTDISINDPTSWSWNFGSWSAADSGVSTLQNSSHTYENAGTYSVSLSARNPDGGDMVTRTGYITVTDPVPSVVDSGFTGSPINGTAPLTVVFNDTSTGGPDEWSWSFGDGDESTSQNTDHTYLEPGTYDVTLTASNILSLNSLTKKGYVTVYPGPYSSYDIPLSAGWNMVSVPVTDPAVTALPSVLGTVYGYDPVGQTYAEANLSALEPGVGYWVSATAGCTLRVNGSYMDCYEADLSSGWNMIGAVCENASFADPETNPAGSVLNSLYGYSPASGTYVTTTTLVPGAGYWASATGACTLNVSA